MRQLLDHKFIPVSRKSNIAPVPLFLCTPQIYSEDLWQTSPLGSWMKNMYLLYHGTGLWFCRYTKVFKNASSEKYSTPLFEEKEKIRSIRSFFLALIHLCFAFCIWRGNISYNEDNTHWEFSWWFHSWYVQHLLQGFPTWSKNLWRSLLCIGRPWGG